MQATRRDEGYPTETVLSMHEEKIFAVLNSLPSQKEMKKLARDLVLPEVIPARDSRGVVDEPTFLEQFDAVTESIFTEW